MAGRRQKPTRAKLRAEQERAAARVTVPTTADVCVIGGGAAGLVAGIVAAEAGARAVVLERDLTCGRTILATGNGRCNFANAVLDPGLYHGSGFVDAVCGGGWLADVLRFFAKSGLAWAEEEGRLYPLSRQAASVRNVLLGRARRAGLVMAPAREVVRLKAKAGKGSVTVAWRDRFGAEETHELAARRVVLSIGGHGATVAGLDELPVRAPSPVLCPIACQGPAGLLDALDGRRVQCEATLLHDGRCMATETGEALFRAYGVSGIAAFNLSRNAMPGDVLSLDLLPSLDETRARRLAKHTLDGLLDPVVSEVLAAQTSGNEEAATLAKHFELTVTGIAQPENAQVTRGGFVTDCFDPATLAAVRLPWLHACGETLDVDGPCGGYNLAWAWKSGMVAGAAAAKEATG